MISSLLNEVLENLYSINGETANVALLTITLSVLNLLSVRSIGGEIIQAPGGRRTILSLATVISIVESPLMIDDTDTSVNELSDKCPNVTLSLEGSLPYHQ